MVELYNAYPYPGSFLLLFLLGMFRFLPIVITAPFLGAKIMPAPVRVGFMLALLAIFLPQLVSLTPIPLQFNVVYITFIIKELVIGFILAFFVSIPFFVASTGGSLIDHQRGTSSLIVAIPSMGIQASPIGVLFNYVMIMVFFSIGGFLFFMQSIALSYNLIPPTSYLPATLFASPYLSFWQEVIHLGNQVLTIATRLAAPALVTLFMSDLFLGIANRMATQVPMTFLGWALKSLAAVGILMLAWQFLFGQFELQAGNWLRYLNLVIESLADPTKHVTPS